MKKSLIALLSLCAIAALLALSCTMPDQTPAADAYTWDRFFAESVQEVSIDGQTRYLIEGDILASEMAEVRQYYDSMLEEPEDGSRATVNVIRKSGKRYADTYNSTVRWNITYKISTAINATTRTNLEWALAQWEGVAGVDFKNITGSSATPVFTIRNATASEENAMPGVIASAFFPSYSNKTLILFNDFYELFASGTFYGWDQKAVLLHELGHGVGLRHEFIWTKNSAGTWTQTGETSAEAYLMSAARDDYSIMFYPQYSAYKGNGRLSSEDSRWIAWLYP
ncbi:MAG: hypothetical protein A2004_09725 [Spirochaetes bacterium GWC1_61_12]|nr:MAG: hypothetical protein A2Y37_10965 [Spirochaetes bacterium GWB1_60_80]OHD33708.1 MAG: hypothetical protein A2004_09725 [Spirochaetes bacterium GWC1_61_12]OHD44958.1 MAG: hypothetical protein A2Y35_13005 [Spirochaetes bacterium GWE1_60_18]OHD60068.1 MAG: hypothetical protein A2Y32_11120 [Spirochaetes bacterium GWF1_60_12]